MVVTYTQHKYMRDTWEKVKQNFYKTIIFSWEWQDIYKIWAVGY